MEVTLPAPVVRTRHRRPRRCRCARTRPRGPRRRRGPIRRRLPRRVLDRRIELPAGSDRRGDTSDHRRRSDRRRDLPPPQRAVALTRRGYKPRGRVHQRRRRDRLVEVLPAPRLVRRRAQHLHRRTRNRPRPSQRPAPRVRRRVRSAAGDAQPLHDRRHDRQQLLRRDRATHRESRRQRRSARSAPLRRHPHVGRRNLRRGV